MKKEVKNLIDKLKIVSNADRTVDVSAWQTVRDIVAWYGQAKVEESKWAECGFFTKKGKPDLSVIETWSTYERCVQLRFFYDGGLKCAANIYNGDNMDGRRLDLRFIAKLLLPDDFIVRISDAVEWTMDDWLNDEHEKYLRKQTEAWKAERLKKELKKIKT
jgi:hypothetical protein